MITVIKIAFIVVVLYDRKFVAWRDKQIKQQKHECCELQVTSRSLSSLVVLVANEYKSDAIN